MKIESESCCGPSCCGGQKASNATSITDVVREKYGAMASSTLSTNNDGVKAVAEAFGYSEDDLKSIPAEANLGLSCGNPTATANLRVGEVVVDLGSGAGLDVFLAAAKVGPTGRAIGIDLTPEMIERAKQNAANGPNGKPYPNVEFHLASIDHLPLKDASVDVIISNCVINLVPEKSKVFAEMFRVLKSGGRVAISDIALKRALPDELAQSVTAYVGCVAGAIDIATYEAQLKSAGFESVSIVDTKSDLNAYSKAEGQSGCCAPSADRSSVHDDLTELMKKHDVNDYAASVRVYAIKK